jgi:hypothetical protein
MTHLKLLFNQRYGIHATFLGLLLALSSCAATYNKINPEGISYTNLTAQDGVTLGYRFAVLEESQNRKYAKKEIKTGIKLVALSLTNGTEKDLTLGQNLFLYAGERQLALADQSATIRALKQRTPSYLGYLLLSFLNVYVDNGIERKIYPVGLVVGPAITIGNMAMASGANNNFTREMMRYNLFNRTIKPGEKVFGLVGLRNTSYDPLSIKLK